MRVIWATRGRTWGFRFLLDGGYDDPLNAYEHAFEGLENEPPGFRRAGDRVALRFADPSGRQDRSGRVIPHDVVVLPPLAGRIRSAEDGLRIVWPQLADVFSRVWDLPKPPSRADIVEALPVDSRERDNGNSPHRAGERDDATS